MKYIFTLLIILWFNYYNLTATIINVGANQKYKLPSQAANVVSDGDTVEFDVGIYPNDACSWTKNNLTLRCTGGFAYLKSGGTTVQGKAIWVISGSNCTVEGIEFAEAAVADWNGAGIRFEGSNLTIRHCFFHDNEDGILIDNDTTGTILIEFSESSHNGHGDGYSHNMYINHIKSFIFRFNYTHLAKVGHCIKTRAYSNYIYCNRIMDEDTGTSSYLLDMPNGGKCYVWGNLFQQGLLTQNNNLVDFGAEGLTNPEQKLFFYNNTMVNDLGKGIYLYIQSGVPVVFFKNNLLAGKGTPVSYTTDLSNNIYLQNTADAGLVSLADYDYHLTKNSLAINNGIALGIVDSMNLTPIYEYVNPCDSTSRVIENKIDIGAYEYHSGESVESERLKSDITNISISQSYDILIIQFPSYIGSSASYMIYDYIGNIYNFGNLDINSQNIAYINLKNIPFGKYLISIYNNNYNFKNSFVN